MAAEISPEEQLKQYIKDYIIQQLQHNQNSMTAQGVFEYLRKVWNEKKEDTEAKKHLIALCNACDADTVFKNMEKECQRFSLRNTYFGIKVFNIEQYADNENKLFEVIDGGKVYYFKKDNEDTSGRKYAVLQATLGLNTSNDKTIEAMVRTAILEYNMKDLCCFGPPKLAIELYIKASAFAKANDIDGVKPWFEYGEKGLDLKEFLDRNRTLLGKDFQTEEQIEHKIKLRKELYNEQKVGAAISNKDLSEMQDEIHKKTKPKP